MQNMIQVQRLTVRLLWSTYYLYAGPITHNLLLDPQFKNITLTVKLLLGVQYDSVFPLCGLLVPNGHLVQ